MSSDIDAGNIPHMKKHILQLDWGLGLARLSGFLSLALGAVVLLGWYLHLTLKLCSFCLGFIR